MLAGPVVSDMPDAACVVRAEATGVGDDSGKPSSARQTYIHTVEADNEEVLDAVGRRLDELGFLREEY